MKEMNFEFEIYQEDDVITIHKHDETFFDIILSDYWIWLKTNDMHLWCNDYYDASQSDRHGQQVGKYSKDEYFELPYSELKADLTKYLLQSKYKKYF